MQITTLKGRNQTADFIKGLLIFCVVYGHSISMVNSLRDVSWTESVVNVFVTSFEMPLFIMVSGYFLAFSLKNGNYGKVLWKRLVSVAIPLAVWEGIPAAVRFVKATVSSGFSLNNLFKIPYACVFPEKLWFLAAFLICSVIVIAVQWVCSKFSQKLGSALSALLYAGILVAINFVRYSLSSVQFLFAFFLLGYYLSKYELLKKPKVRLVCYVLAVLFIPLYPFYKAEYSFYFLQYIRDIRQDVPVMLYRFLLSICGCSLIYTIANAVCKKAPNFCLNKQISRLGQKTMEIYILHMYMQEILRLGFAELLSNKALITDITAPLVFGPAFMVVLLAVCLLLCWLISKSRIVKKILFGR